MLSVFVLIVLLYTLVDQLQATSNPLVDPERATLQGLTTDQVVQVQIVDRCILPAAQIDTIVQALHEAVHFRVTPDSATYFGRLQIALHSGRVQEYRLYQQSYGMVLELTPEVYSPTPVVSSSGARSAAYMISRTFPSVLQCEQVSVAIH